MSLDEKLKGWAEATEALEPSDELLAKLGSMVDAPTPAPAGPSTVVTVVKVLIITALVGAVGYAVMRSQDVAWRWFASSTRADAGLAGKDAGLSGAEVCGPEPLLGTVVPAFPKSPQDFEADRKNLRHQLISRPLTCVAQRNGLEQLLQLGGTEQTRWAARLAFLCGPSVLSPWLVPGPEPAPCDNTDWCHRPACTLTTEACALRWAARAPTTCTHASGVRAALQFACARFLRGEGTEAQVRDLSKDAWCLNPEALKERDELNKRNAPKESP